MPFALENISQKSCPRLTHILVVGHLAVMGVLGNAVYSGWPCAQLRILFVYCRKLGEQTLDTANHPWYME